ncbi:MAG: GNAT family N-acetyltransferase [Brevirhabdus sp.]
MTTLPGAETIMQVVEATWPPARRWRDGPWTIRDGAGGGQRVSAATANGPIHEADFPAAEAAMAVLGQPPLFMIRPGEDALDEMLAARGYVVKDPVTAYACAVDTIALPAPERMTGFPAWPPLHSMEEIWAKGGIGAARLAVMARAPAPKTAILGRTDDQPSGTAFVAIHDKIAMLHALEVDPAHRRKGTGTQILRHAAFWARDNGAELFSLVTTSENLPSNRLYASLKMSIVGQYHYRVGTHS